MLVVQSCKPADCTGLNSIAYNSKEFESKAYKPKPGLNQKNDLKSKTDTKKPESELSFV